jgi:pimeloyl-ACP methyl ester carboxylesterase
MRVLLMILLSLVGAAVLAAGAGWALLHRSDIPFEKLEAKYGYPNSQFAELPGGVRMHYVEQGPEGAPTLLLVHGFSASLHTWDAWAEQLDDSFRVVRVDLPGHGLTRAPAEYRASIETYRETLHAFVDRQGLTNFALAGSSMGGNISWEYALAQPERVAGLILVDSSGFEQTGADRSDDPPVFQILRNSLLGPIFRDLDTRILARQGLRHSFSDPSLVTDAMVDRYVELSRAPGHRQQMLDITLGFQERNHASPARIARLASLPVLILTGAEDNLVPAEHARFFHAAIPGSQLIVYSKVGHVPQEEAPERSAGDVAAFLESVFAAESAPKAP